VQLQLHIQVPDNKRSYGKGSVNDDLFPVFGCQKIEPHEQQRSGNKHNGVSLRIHITKPISAALSQKDFSSRFSIHVNKSKDAAPT
jgi:hypothetical protein